MANMDMNENMTKPDAVAGMLAGWGRDIDELGTFNIEIEPDRTRDDIRENRPGAHLREKILSLPE